MRISFLAFPALACCAFASSAAGANPDPVPVCAPNDARTSIPVWAPTVDALSNVDAPPPQTDGQIVYIRLANADPDATCDNDALNTINLPNADGTPGGLAVNVKGNVQFANGLCHTAGYFMNEDVPGMHQGWVETYFGAVDKQEIVISGRYCLARKID